MDTSIITALIQSIAQSSPFILAVFSVLGTLVVIGQAVVAFTPSKSDDAAWEKIKQIPILGAFISVIANFGVLQKK